MMFSTTIGRACLSAIAAACLLVALGGCGPGVVGTGSGRGDEGGKDVAYAPLAVCTAPFGEAGLACAADHDDRSGGTAPVRWADANKSDSGATVLAALERNTLNLDIPCSEVSFLGNWGELEDGTVAFVGRYAVPAIPEGLPAIVVLEDAPSEPDALGLLRLEDETGAILFGPWLVMRFDGPVTFAACPQ